MSRLKNESGIYAIESQIDGKYYIGSSKTLRTRRNAHFSSLRAGKHSNRHLQRAFNKYGEENFKFNVLEEWDEESRIEREQHYLDLFNDRDNCYNMCPLAGAPTLGKGGFSKEVIEGMRKRMSDPNINPMSKQEHRDKVGNAKRNFTDEKALSICEEFLQGNEVVPLSKENNCSRRAIQTAIARYINNYIEGELTLEENKWRLQEKRVLYNVEWYKEIYNKYMDSDISLNTVEKHLGIPIMRFKTVLKWFEEGKEICGIQADPNFHSRKADKNRRREAGRKTFTEECYLQMYKRFQNGESARAIGKEFGITKSWVRTARRIIKKNNQ